MKALPYRIIYMGTPEFSVPPLKALLSEGYDIAAVVTQPDKPRGRHMETIYSPVKKYALEKGLKILQPYDFSSEEIIVRFKEIDPDIIITAAYGRILPRNVLDIPKHCVNIHASLLPKYRGASPIQNSILNGDEITGITIMEMDTGMDTGDIIYKEEVSIGPDETASDLTVRLAETGARALIRILPDYLTGKIKPVRQDEVQASTVRPVRREDAKIDWNWTAQKVHDAVRAFHPWPGAYTFQRKKRVKILSTAIVEGPLKIHSKCKDTDKPGSVVLSEDKTRLFVKCSDGYIEIRHLQKEGCRCLSADECAHNFLGGTRFGG